MRVNPQQPSATGLQSPVRLFRLSVLLAICLFADLILAADTLLSNSPVYDPAIDNGTYGAYPLQKFKTSPVTAPRANFLTWSPECRDGLYHLLTPKGWSVSDPGPMILDQDGTLIWSQHYSNQYGGQAYNLQVQSYKGEDYLTFWLGDDTVRGHGAGTWYMVRPRSVTNSNGTHADDLIVELVIRCRPQSRSSQRHVRGPARIHHHSARNSPDDTLRYQESRYQTGWTQIQ